MITLKPAVAAVGAGGVDFSGASLVADGELTDPGHATVFSERIGDDLSKKKRATPPSDAEVAASRDRMRALRSDRDKLHHYVDRGKLELWGLDAETVDRAAQDPERLEQLEQAYAERIRSLMRGTAGAELDAETARLLELTGYIEGEDEAPDDRAPDGDGASSGDDEGQAPDSASGRSQ